MPRTDVLKDPKPLYAVAGVGDFAVEKFRGLSDKFISLRDDLKVDPKAVQERARARFGALREDAADLPSRVTGSVKEQGLTYDLLAQRGEKVVARIRNQESTHELVEQAKETVAKARNVGDTAKKGATRTRKAAKATVASARKTGRAAAEATEKATEKVGK